MSKYTYELKFGTGSYAEILPSNSVSMTGTWEEGTMIWREKMDEIKIGRLKNSTVYDTIESWFSDDTKFETEIFVRILKSGVEQSVHYFGVKWGLINQDEKTYSVTPILYDLWNQYFENNTGRIYKVESGGSADFLFYSASGNYVYIDEVRNGERLMDTIKNLVFTVANSWPTANTISSFINQDNYEDASAVGTYRGMPKDYVTGEQSYMTGAGTKYNRDLTFNKLLQWLLLFRVYVFFDSNDKLRFEHIKFFNDKLTNNAVNYSAKIKSYDNVWSYDIVEITGLEILALNTETDDSDSDFKSSEILYSKVRNKPDLETKEHSFELKANLSYYGTGTLAESLLVWGAHENSIYKFFNGDATSFTSDYNTFVVTYSNGQYWGTSDFRVALIGDDFTVSVFVSAISGSFDVYIVDRSSGVTISNKMNVNSTGLNSITLTTTAAADDAYIKFEATANGSATSSYATLVNQNVPEYTIPSIEAIASSAIKTSGAFTTGNIIDRWWQDDRLSREAEVDGSSVTFDDTYYNLRREDVRAYIDTTPNPLYGFNDGSRIGRIEKWTHDLDTDFYSISIIYPEDD